VTRPRDNPPICTTSERGFASSRPFWISWVSGYGDREGFPESPKKEHPFASGRHPWAGTLSLFPWVSPAFSQLHLSWVGIIAADSREQLPSVNPLISPIPDAEIAAILAMDKYWVEDLQWVSRPSNSAILVTGNALRDDTGATIAGLSVECRYRKGAVADRCKYQFTIFLFRGNRERIYQIEVIPQNQKGHRENGVSWFGPHQHFGHTAKPMPDGTQIGCDDYEGAFRTFLKLSNIRFSGRYSHPESNSQLGLAL
jgi:hypothetical protein